MPLPQNWEKMSWFDIGVHAGKSEGWMNLEETLAEDAEHHSGGTDDLVQGGIEGWEQTDHFQIIYGSKMMERAREEAGQDQQEAIDLYLDMKSEFWQGYLDGRLKIGTDVYAEARKILSTRAAKSNTRRKQPKRQSAGVALRGVRQNEH